MTTQTQLSTFNFESHSIRVIVINNEPWFIAKDLCYVLHLSNPSMAIANLDDDEKQLVNASPKLNLGLKNKEVNEVNIVSESGMYTLILRCRDAVKKGSVPHRFRKWVTSEVLPAIRKTGKYEQQPQQLALPNPEQYALRIQDSEEFLALFIKMYGYCFQAHEMEEKLRNTRLGRDIDDAIGGYYLYNFHRPLEQLMKKAKSYIHANTERLALVKAINQLLS